MNNKLKGDKHMTTLTLKDIEKRVVQNSNQFSNKIDQITTQIQSKNLNRGRVRPKDPAEARILNNFGRK